MYQPFNLGNTLAQAENIRGGRIRNNLAEQQGDTRNRLLDEQLTGAQNQNKQFDNAQQQANTEYMYKAHQAVFQNPQIAQHIDNELKRRGIIKPDFQRDYSNLEEIKRNAQIGMEKTQPFLSQRKDTGYSARSDVGGSLVKGVDSQGRPFVTKFDGTRLTGQAALDAIEKDEMSKRQGKISTAVGKAEGIAEVKQSTEPQTAGLVEKSKKEAASNVAKADKAFEAIDTIDTNILNLQDAIQAVRDGASSGPIMSLLPSFRESTKRLENIQKRLGLDVVGATTFGALSKGELDLSKDVALPTGLDGPELVEWIEKRINAQVKMRDYMEKQAIFLSEGNSVADWRKMLSRVPEGVTEDDIKETMRVNNMTRQQVLGRLNLGG